MINEKYYHAQGANSALDLSRVTKLDGNEGIGQRICRWWKQICKFETAANSANSPPRALLAGFSTKYELTIKWL